MIAGLRPRGSERAHRGCGCALGFVSATIITPEVWARPSMHEALFCARRGDAPWERAVACVPPLPPPRDGRRKLFRGEGTEQK